MTMSCLGLFLLIVLIRYAGVLRLTIPLLYAMVVPTALHGWYYSHYALANEIWYDVGHLLWQLHHDEERTSSP